MKTTRTGTMLVLAVCLVCVAAVGQEKQSRVAHVTKDQLILVKDFDTSNTQFQGDHSVDTARMQEKAKRVRPMASAAIVEELKKRGYNGAVYSPGADTPGAIIVDGEFSVMDNGSSASRALIGFGKGKANVHVRVWIYPTEDPSAKRATAELKGTSQGRGGLLALGSLEKKICKRLAVNVVRHLTGKKK